MSVQDGMVVLDWKFDDVNGTYNTTHFEVGFLFSFKTMMMMMTMTMTMMSTVPEFDRIEFVVDFFSIQQS